MIKKLYNKIKNNLNDAQFITVDFYYVNNKIYFGELTFTPNNGMESIKPIERDMEIAGWIDIKKYK